MPPLGARQSNIRGAGFSEVGDLAPSAHVQTLRPVGTRIDDRLAAGNDVGNHMSRARANPEAMTAESGREDKAWNRLHFTDCGNAVRCTVDIAGPDIGDCDAPKLGQQFASSSMCRQYLPHVGAGIKCPVQFHRSYLTERPFRQGFVALAHALECSRGEAAPAPSEQGHEFAAEPELLRRWIDSRASADCQ